MDNISERKKEESRSFFSSSATFYFGFRGRSCAAAVVLSPFEQMAMRGRDQSRGEKSITRALVEKKGARVGANLGSEGSQIEALCVAEGERSGVVFERKVARRVALVQQPAVAAQVAVVGRMNGVETRVVAEFQRKERRGTPRNVGVHLDFVSRVAQMSKTAPTHRA